MIIRRIHFFYLFSAILLTIGTFILWSTSLVLPDLIYPQKIDTVYVQFQKDLYLKEHPNDFAAADSLFNFSPKDIGLQYKSFDVKTIDGLTLRGWEIPSDDSEAISILALHDWNESKIQQLNFAKQMHDRGFAVYLIDLRAHGNSDGQVFSPGISSVRDVKNIADTILNKPGTRHLVLMGSGISAGIVLQSALLDGRFDGIIAQCPFNNFQNILGIYSIKKWKVTNHLFYPVLKRKIEKIIQQPVEQFRMSDYASAIMAPSLFIAASNDHLYTLFDAYTLYALVPTEKKDLFLVNKATHESIELVGGEEYFNRIAAFINEALPKKAVKVRYKKLT